MILVKLTKEDFVHYDLYNESSILIASTDNISGMFTLDKRQIAKLLAEEDLDNIEIRKIVAAQQYALDVCQTDTSHLTKIKVAYEKGFETHQEYAKTLDKLSIFDAIQLFKQYQLEKGGTVDFYDENSSERIIEFASTFTPPVYDIIKWKAEVEINDHSVNILKLEKLCI